MKKHFKIRKDLSMEYYERTLYRIEAIKDLPEHNVDKGDIGGWIEKEENLQGNAWVADEAKVYDDAQVYDDAWIADAAKIFGDAKICKNAKVYGKAEVYGYAEVSGNAEVHGRSKVYGNARVFGNATVMDYAKVYGSAFTFDNAAVSGNAKICGHARVFARAAVCGGIIRHPNGCKNIAGARYNITITPNYIMIGCQCHTKEEWWNFIDREILRMDGKAGLKWWKKWKPVLQLICEEE